MKRLTVSCLALAAAAVASPALAQESVLYDFNSSAGAVQARLLQDKNALYGTTEGYSTNGNYGVVYELRHVGSTWKELTIATFDRTNGALPMAGLIADSSGNLYGTTFQGGAYNGGSVFMLSKSGNSWTLQTIWSFAGTETDGAGPACDLLMDFDRRHLRHHRGWPVRRLQLRHGVQADAIGRGVDGQCALQFHRLQRWQPSERRFGDGQVRRALRNDAARWQQHQRHGRRHGVRTAAERRHLDGNRAACFWQRFGRLQPRLLASAAGDERHTLWSHHRGR